MKNVSIKKIKEQLASGMSREEIITDINSNLPEDQQLNKAEINVLWQHKDLKGIKKAKYKVELNFVEDEPVVETLNAPVQQKSIDFEL
jgi:hypothetical protein